LAKDEIDAISTADFDDLLDEQDITPTSTLCKVENIDEISHLE
jgi:hypothetical protein